MPKKAFDTRSDDSSSSSSSSSSSTSDDHDNNGNGGSTVNLDILIANLQAMQNPELQQTIDGLMQLRATSGAVVPIETFLAFVFSQMGGM